LSINSIKCKYFLVYKTYLSCSVLNTTTTQGDHSPGHVKFPDVTLIFSGTPTHAALTHHATPNCVLHFKHAMLTLLYALIEQTHSE